MMMTTTKWTASEDRRLGNLVVMGLSTAQIAKVLQKNELDVKNNLFSLDLFGRHVIEHKNTEAIMSLHNTQEFTTTQIAVKLGQPVDYVRDRIITITQFENNQKQIMKKKKVAKRTSYTPQEDAKILEGRKNNVPYKEISKSLKNRTVEAISERYRKLTKGKVVSTVVTVPPASVAIAKKRGRKPTINSATIVEQRSKGIPAKEVAELLGISAGSVNSVYSNARKKDPTLPRFDTPAQKSISGKTKRVWTDAKNKQLMELYNANAPMPKITKTLGQSANSVYNQLWKLLHCTDEIVVNPTTETQKACNSINQKKAEETIVNVPTVVNEQVFAGQAAFEQKVITEPVKGDDIITLFRQALDSNKTVVFILPK